MIDLKYEYVKPGEKQYPDLIPGTAVIAKYRRCHGKDSGNPFVEALPPYIVSEEEGLDPYFIPCFNSRDEIYGNEVPKAARMDQVLQLDELRIPPEYAVLLDTAIGQALTASYRKRFRNLTVGDGTVQVCDVKIKKIFNYGDCNDGDLGVSGVIVIGPTGCGKTCAKKMAIAKYPSLIVHEFEGFGTYNQVVYLNAECPANSDLSTLFNTFAEALDKTLGNKTPWFATLMKRIHGVQAKAVYLCRLIEDFSIGALIIDECEHLNFAANSKSSYDAFITLINSTRVSIILVGQSETIDSMTGNAQVKRRFGTTINAGRYCHSFEYFKLLINEVTKYNWRLDGNGRPMSITRLSENECKALYAVCSGSVSMLIKTWILIQQHGIRTDNWPEITYDFVSNLLDRTAPDLEDEIRKKILSDPLNLKRHNPIMVEAITHNKLVQLPRTVWALKNRNPTTYSQQPSVDHQELEPAHALKPTIQDEAIRIVSEHNNENGRKWAEESIISMVEDVSGRKYMKNASANDIANRVIERLRNKSDRRRQKKPDNPVSKTEKDNILMDIGEQIVQKSLEQAHRDA